MKRTLLIPVFLSLCSISYSQGSLEVFAGYSTQRIQTEQFEEFSRFAGLTRSQIQTNFNASAAQLHQGFDESYGAARRLNGINTAATYYFSGGWGVTGDFSYHYRNESRATPNNPIFFEDVTRSRRRIFTVVAGPQYKFNTNPGFQPFVRVLAGVVKQNNRSNQFINAGGGSAQLIETRRLVDAFTAFTAGGGGGLDYAFNQNIAVRLVQVDYLATFTRGRMATLTSGAASLGQTSFENSRRDNLRFSFGVVFRW